VYYCFVAHFAKILFIYAPGEQSITVIRFYLTATAGAAAESAAGAAGADGAK
jgi:hypothetical protein